MHFPLAVLSAVRAVVPQSIPLGLRVSATDWAEGGWDIEQTIRFARAAADLGVQFVCASSGGTANVKVPAAPGYQVAFAQQIKKATGLLTRAVGLITRAQHAERVLAQGQADFIALARGVIDDPRWSWHAADTLGAQTHAPQQYLRARDPSWKKFRDRSDV
jgi:2,4-dienoyl-CoA reductase-like NADH-dependent reductase (Old Yellow Enzyme family)